MEEAIALCNILLGDGLHLFLLTVDTPGRCAEYIGSCEYYSPRKGKAALSHGLSHSTTHGHPQGVWGNQDGHFLEVRLPALFYQDVKGSKKCAPQ